MPLGEQEQLVPLVPPIVGLGFEFGGGETGTVGSSAFESVVWPIE